MYVDGCRATGRGGKWSLINGPRRGRQRDWLWVIRDGPVSTPPRRDSGGRLEDGENRGEEDERKQ